MGKVIEFPGASLSNDADIERGLREGLSRNGFSEKAIEAGVSKAMPLFRESKDLVARELKLRLSLPVSDDQANDIAACLSEELKSYQSGISDFLQKLIVEIALQEARACDV